MDKKKIGASFGLFISLLSGVSAYTSYGSSILSFSGPRDFMERGINFFTNLFGPILYVLLGGNTWTGEFLFEKLLLLIMLIGLIYVILSNTVPMFKDGQNSKVKWIIAIVIPLIALRNLDPAWLNGVILQNAVLAVALSSILPFIIYFFFVMNFGASSHTIRLVSWIFFIIIYIGIWSTSDLEIANYYLLTILVALICLIFDGNIQSYYRKQEMKDARAANAAEILADLHQRYNLMLNSHVLPRQKDKSLKALEKQIAKWEKVIVKNS